MLRTVLFENICCIWRHIIISLSQSCEDVIYIWRHTAINCLLWRWQYRPKHVVAGNKLQLLSAAWAFRLAISIIFEVHGKVIVTVAPLVLNYENPPCDTTLIFPCWVKTCRVIHKVYQNKLCFWWKNCLLFYIVLIIDLCYIGLHEFSKN